MMIKLQRNDFATGAVRSRQIVCWPLGMPLRAGGVVSCGSST